MPTTSWGSIRGDVLRVTREDLCGAPIVGPASTISTKGFASIALSPQYEEGTETVQKNADGTIDWIDKPKDELKYVNATIVFNRVNPDIFSAIMGHPIVLDGLGNAVGVRIGETVQTSFALEGWSDNPGVACAGAKPYGYFLLPWLTGGRLDDFSIANEAATFTISGSRTNPLSPWGVGPYPVVLQAPVGQAAAVAGPLLTPIGPKQHLHMQTTLVPPPAPTPSPIALPA
ncbi:hypothetical protein CH302_19320 [Rhodococcus sp. 15-2388-1-1a]|uniref:hypothetical protein n=1 Tax=Nocardiaceae TaxID=85025 RepID=UPI00056499AE|nr:MULTISPECIES: hypothetical protein [Rhodococcus]OZE95092.1 hypothetical protein CH302_19320 [Rhodococcus sp. 15-2388-1-1a]